MPVPDSPSISTGDGTRARRTAAELDGGSTERREVLEALVHGRLVAAEESDGEPTYQHIHEALISVWHTLTGWLDDDSALAQVPLSFPTYAGILGRVAAKAAQQLNLKMSWVANEMDGDDGGSA